MKLVAVTACPTGIAHCWMAAERIEEIATERGHEVAVEVRSAGGVEEELVAAAVDAADAAIVAADTSLDADRFADLPTVRTSAREAVTSTADVIAEAERAAEESGDSADGDARVGVSAPASQGAEPEDGDDGLLPRAFDLFR